jgi:hypothetical protein
VKPSHVMTTADISVIESLAGWDTPALSNALDALRLRPHNTGHSDGSIQQITGAAPIAGRAVPRMVAREPGEDGIGPWHLHQAIAESGGRSWWSWKTAMIPLERARSWARLTWPCWPPCTCKV